MNIVLTNNQAANLEAILQDEAQDIEEALLNFPPDTAEERSELESRLAILNDLLLAIERASA